MENNREWCDGYGEGPKRPILSQKEEEETMFLYICHLFVTLSK